MVATCRTGVARRWIVLRYLCCLGVTFGLSGCFSGTTSNVVELSGPTMGTEWRISLGASNLAQSELKDADSKLRKSLNQSIVRELDRINGLMSTWDPKSELSLFNISLSTEPTDWNTDSLTVLQAALEVSRATNGAFDVTRGKVFELWGFSAKAPQPSAPSIAKLNSALSQSGWQSIALVDVNKVAKRYAELTIDLSSLAKGFAVDQIGTVLEALGIRHYVVNIGGELMVRGEHSKNRAWRIGVERPNTALATTAIGTSGLASEAASGLELGNTHLATSGSYRNVRIVDGKRVSHLIDGRTGLPVTHSLVAATVLHQSTMLADAWATAYMVLGVEQAQAHALSNDLAVQLTHLSETLSGASEKPKFGTWQSPEWLKLTAFTAE